MNEFTSDHIERNNGFYSFPRIPEMTDEEKQRAYQSIEHSILRAKLLAKKQKEDGTKGESETIV